MMPKQTDVEVPLLQVLASFRTGQAAPSEIYPLLEKKIPSLTPQDLQEKLATGGSKWTNRVQWVRQSLVSKGEMSSPQYGVWAITDAGRARIAKAAPPHAAVGPAPLSFVALHDEYLSQFKENLLERLLELSPGQFEHFARKLLEAYGFVGVKVTGKSGDGGIDGHGSLKVGLARMNVAFQCKRWKSNVPRTEVDKFRGAIQGEFEQGIFFTTAEFTEGAKGASLKKGAVPVVLLDGGSIVELMIDKQFGVQRQPLELYFDEIDRLFTERE